jgi:hypothetical protein
MALESVALIGYHYIALKKTGRVTCGITIVPGQLFGFDYGSFQSAGVLRNVVSPKHINY